MTGRGVRLATLGVAASVLAGCAAREPVTMAAQYPSDRDTVPSVSTGGSKPHPRAVCAVRIAEVRDQRTDPHSLGDAGGQPVRVENSGEWVRSALRSLDGDQGLKFIDQPQADGGELVMDVELLKAYTVHMATDRAATVVIRVQYKRRDAPIEVRIYRGAENSMNWSSGAGETLGSLNTALGKLLEPVRQDILRHCSGG